MTGLQKTAIAALCLALSACQTTAPNDDNALETSAPTVVSRNDPELRELEGLRAGEVRAKLGAPAFLRRDMDAEIWQYYAEGCVLDLFLQGARGVEKAVAHIELRAHGVKPGADRQCLADILKRSSPQS